MATRFDRLDITNFKTFTGETQTLLLSARPTGLHFLQGANKTNPRLGSNGASKSSLWGALCWCLHGRTISGERTTDIRPWHGEGATQVTVTLTVDEEELTLTRRTDPSGLEINGETVGQEDIDRLVGRYDLFCHTILMGQGQPLFLDLSPRDKMHLLSEVLDLERWERRAAAARTEASQYQKTQTRLEGELDGLELAYDQAVSALERTRTESEEWSRQRNSELTRLQKELRRTQKDRDGVQRRADEHHIAADSAGTELKLMRPDLDQAVDQLRQAELDQREAEASARAAQREQQRLQRESDILSEARTCPTCGQPVAPADLELHREEIRAEKARAEREEKNALTRSKHLVRRVSKLQQELEALRERRDRLQTTVDEEEGAYRTLGDRLARLRSSADSLESQLTATESGANPYNELVASARRQANQTEKDLRDAREDLERAKSAAARASFWARGFREIRLSVIDDILEELNLVTQTLLAEVGMGEWEVRYSAERETKSGTTQRSLAAEINSPTSSRRVRWESWSGGEGQRLRLVSALALADVLLAQAGMQTDLLILDEPTQHLSHEGVRDLCELLAQYGEDNQRRIWYTDHHTVESSNFASVVSVINESGVAHLEF